MAHGGGGIEGLRPVPGPIPFTVLYSIGWVDVTVLHICTVVLQVVWEIQNNLDFGPKS